jgi:hypothetical protein
MPAAGPYRRIFFAAIGALALVVSLFIGSGSTQAACGDYVTVVRDGGPADMPDHPAPTPACHGPGCSSAPSGVAPVLAPRPVERPAPAVDSTADHLHLPVIGQAVASPDRPNPVGRYPAEIFHPPRPV